MKYFDNYGERGMFMDGLLTVSVVAELVKVTLL